MQGSQTITVIPEQPRDRQGDPIGDAPESRSIPSCVLIPRQNPDDGSIIVDEFQVVQTDTSIAPPEAEDSIKVPDNPFIDPNKLWYIDGGVGPLTKPSGDVKAIIFYIKAVR